MIAQTQATVKNRLDLQVATTFYYFWLSIGNQKAFVHAIWERNSQITWTIINFIHVIFKVLFNNCMDKLF